MTPNVPFIHRFPVGSEALWGRGGEQMRVRIDSHDHNGEACWMTILDGEYAGSEGVAFFTDLDLESG